MIYTYQGGVIVDEYGEVAVDCENEDVERLLAEEMTESINLVADIAALSHDRRTAVKFLNEAIRLCPEQVGQITGLRCFLEEMTDEPE